MEKTKIYVCISNNSVCYQYRKETKFFDCESNKVKIKKEWHKHDERKTIVTKTGKDGYRNVKVKDSVPFIPVNKDNSTITNYASAVILKLSPLFVYTGLRTVYANTCSEKIRLMMLECVEMASHTDTNKEHFEQSISDGETIATYYENYDIDYEFKKAKQEYKEMALIYNVKLEKYKKDISLYPSKLESVKKSVVEWHNERGLVASDEEINRTLAKVSKPVAPVRPVEPKKSTFEKRAKAREKRNEKQVIFANNRQTTETKTHVYKYVDIDGERKRIETIPETETVKTKFGSVVDSETELAVDFDVLDLIQESNLAIVELINCGLVNSVSDLFAFSRYIYRKINNFISAEKRHVVNGRHESLFFVNDNGEDEIIPLPTFDKGLASVDYADTVNTIRKLIVSNADKRSNTGNLLKVFELCYCKDYSNVDCAKKINVNEKVVRRCRKQIDNIFSSAELKTELHKILFG